MPYSAARRHVASFLALRGRKERRLAPRGIALVLGLGALLPPGVAPLSASEHSAPITANLNVADGALATTAALVPEGLLVGRHTPPSAGAASHFKVWASLPFTDAAFVENTLDIPFGRTVSHVSVGLTVHAGQTSLAPGSFTFHLHGLTDHSRLPDPAADTWQTVAGNATGSATALNPSETTYLASVTLDASSLLPGQSVTFASAALTEFVNTALDRYFYTNKTQRTLPSGIVLIVTPDDADAPGVLFEREPVLRHEQRYFNGQVGSGKEAEVFDPAYDRPPIPGNSPELVAWATGVASLERGYIQITNTSLTYTNAGVASNRATFGLPANALGPASGANPSNPYEVVSLGDGGAITLTFAKPIANGPGWDFAVFENGFIDYTNHALGDSMAFLELAHVEVSSDGVNFVRFPSLSLTRPYVGGNYAGGEGFAATRASTIHNLAGKYILGHGTPFDLDDVVGLDPLVDAARITHVRVIDVVGINRRSMLKTRTGTNPVTGAPIYTTIAAAEDPAAMVLVNHDSEGNEIVDPWPTPFWQGGFDLDAVGVRHQYEEPAGLTWTSWLAQHFTPAELDAPDIGGATADPDGDGVSNLLEYALGGNPCAADPAILPRAGQNSEGLLTLTFARLRADLLYLVEGSGDLNDWETLVINPGAVGESVTVADSIAAPRRFLRLRITPAE